MDKIKALIVEDNPTWYNYFMETIGKSNDNFLAFDHAKDMGTALSKIHDFNPELILLDLMLPDSQGAETIRRMTEAANLIPIVVITTIDDNQMNEIALQSGVQDYLVKDEYDEKIFFHVVRQSIKRAMQRATTNAKDSLEQVMKRLQKIDQSLSYLELSLGSAS